MPTSDSASRKVCPSREPTRTLSDIADLRLEVRAMTRKARRLAVAKGNGEKVGIRKALQDLFEEWLARSSDHALLICMASAVEFGVPVRAHAERCRSWVVRHESQALRALYWTALHRSRANHRTVTRFPEVRARCACHLTPSFTKRARDAST